MKDLMKLSFLLLFALGILISCGEDDPEPTPDPDKEEVTLTDAQVITQNVNKFMNEAMNQYYLWYDKMPDIDYESENDSKEYFEKLLYTDDRWSFVTEDVEALENSFEGKEKSYGWSLAFGTFSNTGNIFAIVEYVYPNTPASEAGIKRGDLIISMNNADITLDNYTDLLYGETMNATLGVLANNSISAGGSVDMTARELVLNPVVKTSVVEEGDHKIGYVFYAQYIANFNEALDTAFQSMRDQQVTDLVLDLRYNPGGGVSAAQHMCSALAPLSAVNNNSTLVSYQWNDKLQQYWEDNQIVSQMQVLLDNQVAVKMGLNKIHILTGSGTASASELTITGLKPYMTEGVITVGDTTHGKYAASITLAPEDIYESESYYKDFENWAIQPIVLRYANSLGVTDFKNGFAPDILAYDDLFDAYPLGDKNDPLFKAAIEDITGTEIVALKSAKKMNMPYTIFDRGFSKFDENKRQMLIDNIDLLPTR